MASVPTQIDPQDPESIARWVREAAFAINGRLSEGDPTHPVDTSQFPNGTQDNLTGSWVTATFTALDTATTCTHNLDQSVVGIGSPITSPNVAWQVWGIKHSGVGVVGGGEPVAILYEINDPVTADAIDLRAYAVGGRTVDVTNPLTVLLRFRGVAPW